jgi:hypothetical protein
MTTISRPAGIFDENSDACIVTEKYFILNSILQEEKISSVYL